MRILIFYVILQFELYLWLIVFWLQPHKEERFLFPIYPLIVLSGALLLDTVQRLLHLLFATFSKKYKDCRNYTMSSWWLVTLVISVFAFLSTSRIVGLYQVSNCLLILKLIFLFISDIRKMYLYLFEWRRINKVNSCFLIGMIIIYFNYDFQHYNGSMSIWNDVSLLQETKHVSNVCVSKEWHRQDIKQYCLLILDNFKVQTNIFKK